MYLNIRKTIRISLWALLVFLVLTCSGLAMLHVVGGANDELKDGLEEFFSESSGGLAHIDKLNNFTLFPLVEIDIEGLLLKDNDEKETDPWLKAESVKLKMRFWDVFFFRKYVLDLGIKGLKISPGRFGPAGLSLESAGLVAGQDGSFFLAAGRYGNIPVTLRTPVKIRQNKKYGHLFALSDTFPLEVGLGRAGMTAEYFPPDSSENGYELRSLRFFLEEGIVLEGSVGRRPEDGENHVFGHLSSGATSWDFSSNSGKEKSEINLDFKTLRVEDFSGEGPFARVAAFIGCGTMLSPDEVKEETTGNTERKTIVHVSVEHLEKGGKDLGSMKTDLTLNETGASAVSEGVGSKEEVAELLKAVLARPDPGKCSQ